MSISSSPSSLSSSFSMSGMGSLTSKMSYSMKGMSLPSSITIPSIGTSESKREEKEEKERRMKVSQVLSLLEDVRLQLPQTHAGLVIAYTAATLSPISSPGIKFTWYRMAKESDQFNQVDESYRAWYAPTFDDIGSKICAQCEDAYGQGFSRYMESGFIEADPVLCSLAESAIEKGFFEVSDTGISLGTDIMEITADSLSTSNLFSEVKSRPTALSKTSSAFLQLEGRSTVEVDSDGIFISLPIPARETDGTSGRTSTTSTHRKVRRGLQIPASESISVECAQPVSLILTIKLSRGYSVDGATIVDPTLNEKLSTIDSPTTIETLDNQSSPSSSSSGSSSSSSSKAEDTATVDTSNSNSTPSIDEAVIAAPIIVPWSYVRILNQSPSPQHQSHEGPPGAGESTHVKSISSHSHIEDEEHEAASFGAALMSLELLVASLPDTTNEIKICVSCGDRMQRDSLVACIKALTCQRIGTSAAVRLRSLPWRSDTTGEKIFVSEVSEAGLEAGRRLHQLEQENAKLKMEAQELQLQLLESNNEKHERNNQKNDDFSRYEDGAKEHGGRRSSTGSGSGSESGSSDDVVINALVKISTDADYDNDKNNDNSNDNISSSVESSCTESGVAVNAEREVGNECNDTDKVARINAEGSPQVDEASVKAQVETQRNSIENSSSSSASDTRRRKSDSEGASNNVAVQMLSAKVLELENKATSWARRETDSAKLRQELETRNAQLVSEAELRKKAAAETREELSCLRKEHTLLQQAHLTSQTHEATLEKELSISMAKLKDLEALVPLLSSREKEIEELKSSLDKNSKSLAEIMISRDELQVHFNANNIELDSVKKELSVATSTIALKMTEIIEMSSKIESLNAENKAQAEALKKYEKLEEDHKEMTAKADRLHGEINHINKRAESQARDLKKVVKESALTISEYEKALIRKGEECGEYEMKIMKLEQELASAQAQLLVPPTTNPNPITASSLFSGLSSRPLSINREIEQTESSNPPLLDSATMSTLPPSPTSSAVASSSSSSTSISNPNQVVSSSSAQKLSSLVTGAAEGGRRASFMLSSLLSLPSNSNSNSNSNSRGTSAGLEDKEREEKSVLDE